MPKNTLWTIGHSTHSIEAFMELLACNNIEAIVDVRSLPGSNKFPQFNKENLEISLAKAGIEYMHLLLLGGRRKKNKNSQNTSWRNASFQAYADYMETEDFTKGMNILKELAIKKRVAIMCAEVLWWRCHRSMIADQLKSEEWTIMHIMSRTKNDEHRYTQPAKIIDGKLSY